MLRLPPRIVIGATRSSAGKTSLAAGLAGAFSRLGLKVACAKVGPDYLDPTYLRIASGRPAANLDFFLSHPDEAVGVLATLSKGADLLIIEGVMGLFDGTALVQPPSERIPHASTAHVALATQSPVLLCMDASAASSSVAAEAHGFATYAPGLRVAGLVVNKVGGEAHLHYLKSSLGSLPIECVGLVPRSEKLHLPSRYLGLVPADSLSGVRQAISQLAETVSSRLDIARILAIAQTAAPLEVSVPGPCDPSATARSVIAAACGEAFCFCYQSLEHVAGLEGAEIAWFDPMSEPIPEEAGALYLPGGYPEMRAKELAESPYFYSGLRRAAASGMPILAECGGYLVLGRSIDDTPAAGLLPFRAFEGERTKVGYRFLRPRRESFVSGAGSPLPAHEHHRYQVEAEAGHIRYEAVAESGTAGWATGSMFASFFHVVGPAGSIALSSLCEAARQFRKRMHH